MHFTIQREALLKPLQLVAGVVERRAAPARGMEDGQQERPGRQGGEAHRAIAVGIVKGDAAMTVDAVEAHLSDIEQRMIESLV